jgi:hypothetical protein
MLSSVKFTGTRDSGVEAAVESCTAFQRFCRLMGGQPGDPARRRTCDAGEEDQIAAVTHGNGMLTSSLAFCTSITAARSRWTCSTGPLSTVRVQGSYSGERR